MNQPLLIPWLDEMEEGKVIHTITIPPRVIYHYTNLDAARLIIKSHKLRFSHPDRFNDPLDLSIIGLIDFQPSRERVVEWVNRVYTHYNRYQKNQQIKFILSNKPLARKGYLESFKQLRNQMSVCCFSKDPSVFLMWSHYAHHHTGIAFGFNVHPYRADFWLQPVKYLDKIIPYNVYDMKEEVIHYWMFTKSRVWDYEKEIRGVFQRGSGDFSFDKLCLKEIYFGCQVKEEVRKEIINLLKEYGYRNISFKRMIIDRDSFGVKAKEMAEKL